MNRNQEALYSMLVRMQNLFLDTNPVIIAKMPKMDIAINNLADYIENIKACFEIKLINKSGIAFGKQILKEDVANAVFLLSGKIKSYTINEMLYTLQSEVSYTQSRLLHLSDIKLIATTNTIINIATTNLSNLAIYGVTQQLIDATQTIINTYEANIPKPKESITNKKIATMHLGMLYKEAKKMIKNTMATYVIIVKDTDQQFFEEFQLTRIIKKPQSYPIDFKCIVKNQEGTALQKATCIFQDSTKVYKTTVKGQFHIKSLPSGNHSCTFHAYGYATQTLIVPTTKGVRKNLSITLLANS
jgi:hypothetical protein